MDSRRAKTKIFDQNIAEITEIYNDKNGEIQKYRDEIKEIENEMSTRYISTYDSLNQYGQSLSVINDKLYHSNIETLFLSKCDPKFVQNHIEDVTKSALKMMSIPNELIEEKINEHRLEIYYKEAPEKKKNKKQKHEAMDVDDKENENLTPKQKEKQKLMIEMEQINEEFKKMDTEYNELFEVHKRTELEDKNCEICHAKQSGEIWTLYNTKFTTSEV